MKIFTQHFERKHCSFPSRLGKLLDSCVLIRAGRRVVYFDDYCTLVGSEENVGNGEEDSEGRKYSLTTVVSPSYCC